MLNESTIKFAVEIPEEFIPDNMFASLLFQNLDLYINHELITTKSSDSDYGISNFIFIRDGHNESYLESNGIAEGYFEDRMRDLTDYITANGKLSPGGKAHLEKKREYSEEIVKDGVKYFRYYFICGLNHGLARQDKPLPSG